MNVLKTPPIGEAGPVSSAVSGSPSTAGTLIAADAAAAACTCGRPSFPACVDGPFATYGHAAVLAVIDDVSCPSRP